jgi:1,2-diacylglycerol 3-alpha-glucosyltransferase
MTCRLLAISEIISPYRIPVFNALASQAGIDLHVIFLAENDPTLRQWLVYENEIGFSCEVLPSFRRRVGRQSILLNRNLHGALARFSPECVLVGGYNYVASWQALSWARRKQVKFLLWAESTTRDKRASYRMIEFLKVAFLRRCDGFVVPGKSSSEYLNSYHVPASAIFAAPNAVDIDLFARLAAETRNDDARQRKALQLPARFFLFVGRLVPEKGVFDLLEAYGKLGPTLRAEIGMVFAGDGQARSELSARAAAIEPGAVRFTGFLQRECLARHYALAEALVFPTWADAWGMVVNEAMACGLPIILSDAAGCSADLVEDPWNGRMVRAGDIYQLAAAMAQLAGDSKASATMGQHSRQRIREYSPQMCAAGIARAAFSCVGAQHG